MLFSVTVSTTDFDSVSLGSNPKRASEKNSSLYIFIHCGVVAAVARQAHNLEVTGSNPVPATIKIWKVEKLYLTL